MALARRKPTDLLLQSGNGWEEETDLMLHSGIGWHWLGGKQLTSCYIVAWGGTDWKEDN